MFLLMNSLSFSASGNTKIMIDNVHNPNDNVFLKMGKTWIVDDEGDGDFVEIQAAIDNDALNDGDLIQVYSGEYNSVIIEDQKKKITIEGISHELGEGNDLDKPLVTSFSLKDIESYCIHGFNMEHGLAMISCDDIEIYDNYIAPLRAGWSFNDDAYGCDHSKIYNNYISLDDNFNPFHNCNYNEIINNHISYDCDYISTSGSDNWDIRYSSNNKIIGNSFHNVDLNMMSCNDNEIKDNTMTTSDTPCFLDMLESNNNKIINNEMAGDMEMYYCEYNEIKGNNIHGSSGGGIFLFGSTNTTIVENNITDQWIGIEGIGGYTQIYHNNFINNRNDVNFQGEVNTWDDGIGKGNYWDEYHGIDADGDGIGDTPYSITGGDDQDNYPLMKPYGKSKIKSIHPALFDTIIMKFLEKLPVIYQIIQRFLKL